MSIESSTIGSSNIRFQAPKSLPPAAKQSLILTYLRSTNTVHSLKDLEKCLPSVASINGMQVKEYLQALSDENQIHVEKIGSGNWYWSFMSEEKKAREGVLRTLRDEKQKSEKAMEDLRERIEEAKAGVGEGGAEGERDELMKKYTGGKEELETLREELAGYSDCDPGEIVRKRQEYTDLKARAETWTENIYCLEAYLKQVTGGDCQALERIREEYYGTEYVAGEGLREL